MPGGVSVGAGGAAVGCRKGPGWGSVGSQLTPDTMKISRRFLLLLLSIGVVATAVAEPFTISVGRAEAPRAAVPVFSAVVRADSAPFALPFSSPFIPSLPGQIVPPLRRQMVESLPGEVVRSLPGQMVRSLPGQWVQALPGQLVPPLPGQIVR